MSAISTKRLALRPLRKPSTRNLAWLRDPEVVRYSEQRHESHTISTQLRYVEQFTGRSKLWGIYLIESGAHIGNVSATHDEPNNVSDVAIMIGESMFWGQGYAGEAWRAACDWLLHRDEGNIRKLEAGCMATNLAMAKIIAKTGFKQEGERLNHFMVNGHPVSALLFGRVQ